MNFDAYLTEEQKNLRDMFRDFTDKEIRSKAQQMDESGKMDLELWKKMAEIGSYGIIIPEEYGGCGLGFVELMLVLEEVVKGAGTVYHWVASANGPNSSSVLKFGTEEQKGKYVPSIVGGEAMGACA